MKKEYNWRPSDPSVRTQHKYDMEADRWVSSLGNKSPLGVEQQQQQSIKSAFEPYQIGLLSMILELFWEGAINVFKHIKMIWKS